RRKDGEVEVGRAGNLRGRGEHRVDRWIGVIEAHRVDAVEIRQIVFVRRVISVPGDDVERRVFVLGFPQAAEKLDNDTVVAVAIFVGGGGRLEIARVGQAVGADRTKLGEAQQGAVIFADVAARLNPTTRRRLA